MMNARSAPFTHTRHARGFQAERDMLDLMERDDEHAERMIDRMLRTIGFAPASATTTFQTTNTPHSK